MKTFKAEVEITLRQGILDVQGKTVESALASIGLVAITNVRIGKFVQLVVEAESESDAIKMIDTACRDLIANPIIEDYNIEIKDIK